MKSLFLATDNAPGTTMSPAYAAGFFIRSYRDEQFHRVRSLYENLAGRSLTQWAIVTTTV